jgi:long-chain acyl-CoA synthetase
MQTEAALSPLGGETDVYTFAKPLERALATASGCCAVVCQDDRRTYAELGTRCRRLGGALRALGLMPGDRVGVIGLNSDRYLELYLGVPAAGLVLVPVNSRLAPAEMRAILADAGVSVLFADADYPGAADVKQVLSLPGDYEELLAAAGEADLGAGVAENDLPRHVELRSEPLPKSAAGKILKRELREPHWAGQQAYVSGG